MKTSSLSISGTWAWTSCITDTSSMTLTSFSTPTLEPFLAPELQALFPLLLAIYKCGPKSSPSTYPRLAVSPLVLASPMIYHINKAPSSMPPSSWTPACQTHSVLPDIRFYGTGVINVFTFKGQSGEGNEGGVWV